MKVRPLIGLVICVALLLCLEPNALAQQASTGWLLVRTNNFTVVARARERQVRKLADRIELLHGALSTVFPRMFGGENTGPRVPTTIIIFPDDASYAPFKPATQGRSGGGIAGHFQSSPETNYIAVSLEGDYDELTFQTLVHEYVHDLSGYYFRSTPIWFREGLSEYFSTARIVGGRQLALGARVKSNQRATQGGLPFSLETLIQVNESSTLYRDERQRVLLYAESWALVHYFLNGGNETRGAQFTRFLDLLSTGADARRAFYDVFGADVDAIEDELRSYTRAGHYAERFEPLDRRIVRDQATQISPITETQATAYLGDMLLRAGRDDEAEAYLRRAIDSDSPSAGVHVSLGILRLRQNRLNEARQLLLRAVELDPQSYLARFHLADVLMREGIEGVTSPAEFDEKTRHIRRELKHSIELQPTFVEAYRSLAILELERGDQMDQATELLQKGIRLFPLRRDLPMLLAQVRIRTRDFAGARMLLDSVMRRCGDPEQLASAARLRAMIATKEEEERKAATEALLAATPTEEFQPCDMPDPGPYQKRLRFRGQQACGRLIEIDCEGDGVLLLVDAGSARPLRLRANALGRVRFVTYTTTVRTGALTCGVREPANPVLVTYRARKDAHEVDGDLIAVEFIPPDWNR
jgi:tetratricopeptide (TPR) repeat protein